MATARQNEGALSLHDTTAEGRTLRLRSVQAEVAARRAEVYPRRGEDNGVVVSSVVTLGNGHLVTIW